jgi:hypothetical protein
MRIKMLTLAAGPDGVFQPGDERDVADAVGKALVLARSAVCLDPTPTAEASYSHADAAVTESAVARHPGAESAVHPRGKSRGK